MNVDRLSLLGTALNTQKGHKKENKKSTKNASSISFSGKLTESDHKAMLDEMALELPHLTGEDALESLLDEVHIAGETLKKDAVFKHMNQYKNAVRRFMGYVVQHGLEVHESAGIRNPKTMQQKKYMVIRVIDEKLEKLAASVLRGQIQQFDILQKVDEINGLLVDLTR